MTASKNFKKILICGAANCVSATKLKSTKVIENKKIIHGMQVMWGDFKNKKSHMAYIVWDKT